MNEVRKAVARIDRAVKRIDPSVIVQRTFYDEASGRISVSLVSGLQEYEFGLRLDHLGPDNPDSLDKVLEAAVTKLKQQPTS
jgi:hypothetical protein